MTDYKIASNGIARIFKGEILEIISIVAIALASIAAIFTIAAVNTEETGGAVAAGIITAILLIGGGVVAIIAFIFELMGMNRAGSQNSNFKTALYIVLFSFLLTIVNIVLSMLIKDSSIGSTIASTAKTVLDAAATIFILNGCGELLTQKGNTELADEVSTVLTRVLIAFALSAILTFIPGFVGDTASLIMLIASVICSLIAYIQYLIVLKKSYTALAVE